MKKVNKYFNEELTLEKMQSVSKAGYGLLTWVVAIMKYYDVAKNVNPLRNKVKEMEKAQRQTEQELGELQVRALGGVREWPRGGCTCVRTGMLRPSSICHQHLSPTNAPPHVSFPSFSSFSPFSSFFLPHKGAAGATEQGLRRAECAVQRGQRGVRRAADRGLSHVQGASLARLEMRCVCGGSLSSRHTICLPISKVRVNGRTSGAWITHTSHISPPPLHACSSASPPPQN